MDCLRSFVVSLEYNVGYVDGTPNIKIWTFPQVGYAIQDEFTQTWAIEGYKNINIFGVAMTGDVTPSLASGASIIRDFSIDVFLDGQTPIIGNQFISGSPEGPLINFSGYATQKFQLSKYNTSINFANPYQSVKEISWRTFRASGTNIENYTEITLLVNLNFTFYYQFEGE